MLGGCSLASLLVVLSSVHAAPDAPILDIWSWGSNDAGKLGSVPPNLTVPWPIHVQKRWIAVAGGGGHSVALTADGEVWTWGSNEKGELGNGTNAPSLLPQKVPGLGGITLIAAGLSYTLAYRASDGVLFAWGSNTVGQLGQPDTLLSSNVPVEIAVPGTLVQLSAGGAHAVALTSDGRVYAWGGNARGQIGFGDFVDHRVPVLVPLPGRARSVGAGASHTIAALDPDGAVYTWGWNVFGQLGRGYDGTPTDGEATPSPAIGVTDATEVTAGDLHCLARTSDGHVWAWGYNTEGQLGNGPRDPLIDHNSTPVVLSTIDRVADVDAGGIFSLARKDDGSLWSWGDGRFGATGTNQKVDAGYPARVLLDRPAAAYSAGGSHGLVIAAPRNANLITVAGTDVNPGAPTSRPAVRDVTGPTDIADVASGYHHTLVLDGAHHVWVFGKNDHGQLGTSGGDLSQPTELDLPLDGTPGFVQVAAHANQSFAVRADGALFAWGDGSYGQLGVGVAADAVPPTVVNLGEPAARVAAGERHGLVLSLGGVVYAFGQNLHGELGTIPTDKLTLAPAVVPLVQNAVTIAAGGFHSLAVTAPGELMAWGSGFRGQLAETLSDSRRPVIVRFNLRDVMTASAGRFHSVVTRAGGGVSVFGDNTACQCGTSPGSDWLPRTDVPFQALYAVAGDYHTVAIGLDGSVVAWGDDGSGQLGRADTTLIHSDCDLQPLTPSGATVIAAGAGHTIVVHASAPPPPELDAGRTD